MDKVEYDPSLNKLLIDEGFDRGDMTFILSDHGEAYGCEKSYQQTYMDAIRNSYQEGCIVVLPWKGFFLDTPADDPRMKWIVVFYSPFSTSEIRRRVALKAFL